MWIVFVMYYFYFIIDCMVFYDLCYDCLKFVKYDGKRFVVYNDMIDIKMYWILFLLNYLLYMFFYLLWCYDIFVLCLISMWIIFKFEI